MVVASLPPQHLDSSRTSYEFHDRPLMPARLRPMRVETNENFVSDQDLSYARLLCMEDSKKITLKKYSIRGDVSDTDFDYWRQAGCQAIWNAINELTLFGYALQGQELENRTTIDSSVFQKLPVPWLVPTDLES